MMAAEQSGPDYTRYKFKTYTCSNYTKEELLEMKKLIDTSTKFTWTRTFRPMKGNYKIFFAARYYDDEIEKKRNYLISNTTRRKILKQISNYLEHPEMKSDKISAQWNPRIPVNYLKPSDNGTYI